MIAPLHTASAPSAVQNIPCLPQSFLPPNRPPMDLQHRNSHVNSQEADEGCNSLAHIAGCAAHLKMPVSMTGSSYLSMSGLNLGDCLSFSKFLSVRILPNWSKPDCIDVSNASSPASTCTPLHPFRKQPHFKSVSDCSQKVFCTFYSSEKLR